MFNMKQHVDICSDIIKKCNSFQPALEALDKTISLMLWDLY